MEKLVTLSFYGIVAVSFPYYVAEFEVNVLPWLIRYSTKDLLFFYLRLTQLHEFDRAAFLRWAVAERVILYEHRFLSTPNSAALLICSTWIEAIFIYYKMLRHDPNSSTYWGFIRVKYRLWNLNLKLFHSLIRLNCRSKGINSAISF